MSEKKFEAKVITVTEDGHAVTYKRTEKGYCTRDGKRISAKAFAEAEDLHDSELLSQIEDNLAWVDETIKKVKAMSGDEAVEVAAEVPEPVVGNTEQVYADEPVPVKPEFDIPGVKKDQATVGHRNGHEYVHDWFGKRYFRDGVEVTKFEYEHEVYGTDPKAVKKSPKAKRVRKPKDVAGTFETSEGTVTLTLRQRCFLTDLSHLGEDELLGNVHGGIWCDVLCDQIGGQFAGKPMSVGAMLSTICEKGLGERFKEKRDNGGRGKLVTVFRLTKKGEEVWEELGF